MLLEPQLCSILFSVNLSIFLFFKNPHRFVDLEQNSLYLPVSSSLNLTEYPGNNSTDNHRKILNDSVKR